MLNSYLLSRDEIDDAAWDAFIEASPQRYLYYYSWYLDAACPGWFAVVVVQNGRWVGVMPLPIRKKGFFRYAFQPPLMQFLGIVFCPAQMERHRYYKFVKEVSQSAIETLPPLAAFDLNLHPDLHYFLPFYWKKFEVKARFTYWLPLAGDFQDLQKSFSRSVSDAVKKAKKAGIAVHIAGDETALLQLLRKEKFFDEMHSVAFSRVWKEVKRRGKDFLLYATDPEGRLCSAAAFILDGDEVLFFANVQDKARKASGANALIVSEAIRIFSERGNIRRFNFEGSMLEGVEQYLRSFNPEAKIYFSVSKYQFPLFFRLYRKFKAFF